MLPGAKVLPARCAIGRCCCLPRLSSLPSFSRERLTAKAHCCSRLCLLCGRSNRYATPFGLKRGILAKRFLGCWRELFWWIGWLPRGRRAISESFSSPFSLPPCYFNDSCRLREACFTHIRTRDNTVPAPAESARGTFHKHAIAPPSGYTPGELHPGRSVNKAVSRGSFREIAPGHRATSARETPSRAAPLFPGLPPCLHTASLSMQNPPTREPPARCP